MLMCEVAARPSWNLPEGVRVSTWIGRCDAIGTRTCHDKSDYAWVAYDSAINK